ncbi:hypothetical protein LCGC14_2081500, partial [marine sediment metagenome]
MCAEHASIDLDGPAEADPPAGDVRRNYTLGVLSGAVGTMSFQFMHPELILAGMIYALTESTMLVALVTVVSKACILAPQLLVGHRLEHHALKRPFFIGLGIVKFFAVAGMVLAISRLSPGSTGWPLVLFYLTYAIACTCAGAGYVVFMDMAGRMIPSGKVGSFFGMRHFLGGVLAPVLALVVIHPVLTKVTLPFNYVIVVATGAVLAVVNLALFAMCRESPGPKARTPTTLGESLRRGMGWLRSDRNYRNYFWQRVAFRVNYLGLAFYIPFGHRTLARGRSAAEVALLGGIMVGTMILGSTVASALWGRVADRHGYRRCMMGAGVLFTLGPALALAAPRLQAVTTAVDLPLTVYLLALLAMASGIQGSVIGGTQFMVTTAPPHRRISYVAFQNTITSPLT